MGICGEHLINLDRFCTSLVIISIRVFFSLSKVSCLHVIPFFIYTAALNFQFCASKMDVPEHGLPSAVVEPLKYLVQRKRINMMHR